MSDKIQNRRGNKATLPTLDPGEMGLCQDTEEVFIGGETRNIPVLTLKESVGKPLGIDHKTLILTEEGVLKVNTADVAEQDNTLPITSAAVHVEIGNIDALLQTI